MRQKQMFGAFWVLILEISMPGIFCQDEEGPKVFLKSQEKIEQRWNRLTKRWETINEGETIGKLTVFLQRACKECRIITKEDRAGFIIKITARPHSWTVFDNRGDGKMIATKDNIWRLENVMKDATAAIRKARDSPEKP